MRWHSVIGQLADPPMSYEQGSPSSLLADSSGPRIGWKNHEQLINELTSFSFRLERESRRVIPESRVGGFTLHAVSVPEPSSYLGYVGSPGDYSQSIWVVIFRTPAARRQTKSAELPANTNPARRSDPTRVQALSSTTNMLENLRSQLIYIEEGRNGPPTTFQSPAHDPQALESTERMSDSIEMDSFLSRPLLPLDHRTC